MGNQMHTAMEPTSPHYDQPTMFEGLPAAEAVPLAPIPHKEGEQAAPIPPSVAAKGVKRKLSEKAAEEPARTRPLVQVPVAPGACMQAQRIFDEAMTTVPCSPRDLFFLQDQLGAGAYGTVYLATVVNPELKAFIVKQGAPEKVAVKIQRFSYADTPFFKEVLQTEIAINTIINRSSIPTHHYVRSFWWKRMNADASPHPGVVQVEIFEFASRKSLDTIMTTIMHITESSARFSPLDTRIFVMQVIWACLIAQIFVGLELIRAVMPNFVHGDLHTGNVLGDDRNDFNTLVYDIGSGITLTVPLLYTEQCVLKIADMGYASGSYTTGDGVSHAIGKIRGGGYSRPDHMVAHEELALKFEYADKPAWTKFSESEAYVRWNEFVRSYARLPSYAFALATQPLFEPIRGPDAASKLERGLGFQSSAIVRPANVSLKVAHSYFTAPLQSRIVRLPVASSVQRETLVPCTKCNNL